MRTTLTLDDDVFRMIEEEAHRTRSPVKQVVNDALRKGLSPGLKKTKPNKVRVPTFDSGPTAGIDPGSLNRLVDELEELRVDRRR